MVHNNAGTCQRKAVFCEAAAAPWTAWGLTIPRAKANMLHDDIVGFDVYVVATNDDPVPGSCLARDCKLVSIEHDGGFQLNVPGNVEDYRTWTGLTVRAFSKSSSAGIPEVRHMTDVAAATSLSKHPLSLSPWKSRAIARHTRRRWPTTETI